MLGSRFGIRLVVLPALVVLLSGCDELITDLENVSRARDGRPLLETEDEKYSREHYTRMMAMVGRTLQSARAKLRDTGENLESNDGATLSLGVAGPVGRLPGGPPVIAGVEATVLDSGKGKPGAAGSESSSTDIFGRATVGVPFGFAPGGQGQRSVFIMPYAGAQVLGASTERSAGGFNSSNDFFGAGPVAGAEFVWWLDPFGPSAPTNRSPAAANARESMISFSLDVSGAALFGTLKERSNAGFRSNDSRTLFQGTARASITYWVTNTFGLSIGGGVNHITNVQDATAGAGNDGSNDRTTLFITAGGRVVLR